MNRKLPLTSVFVKRLDLVMTSKGIASDIQKRAKELSLFCIVTPQAARKWLTGKSLPDYDNMMRIANRYSVTTSYLLGEINIKTIGDGDVGSVLKGGNRKGAITVEITEDMFSDELKKGDTAICQPCDEVIINNAIYLLQSSNNRFFRKLAYNETKDLIISYDENGKNVVNTYTDKSMIELFLASLVGRVEAIIRKLA